MVAVMASSTVQLSFAGHRVPPERVTATLPFAQWPSRDAAGLRANGSLALGLAARCCELIGPGPLDEQLAQVRTALDSAGPDAMPGARAAACELALRATAALVVSQGSSAILAGQDAQRLAREALFLLVFGSRPPIRQALGGLLTRPVGHRYSSRVIVRDARPGELAEIGDLRVAAYQAGGFLADASNYGETLRTLGHDGTGQILVAVGSETDVILGTVMLQPPPHAGHVVRGPDEAEVRALAVAPQARGRGVGRALLSGGHRPGQGLRSAAPGAVHPDDHARRAASLHRGRVPPHARARLAAGARVHAAGLRLGAGRLGHWAGHWRLGQPPGLEPG